MLHTVPDFELALNGMRADFGLAPIDQQTIQPMVGKGSEKLIRDVLALDYDSGRIDAVFDDAMAAYERHYLAINGERATLFPDVIEGLGALQQSGLRLACVTNKPIAFTLPLLEKKGLAPWFEIVYGGDSLPRKKPDPLPLQQVCRDFGLLPSQVVAIGDSSNDAEAARAAGCFVLTVPYGYNHGKPVQTINSDGIVNSLLDAANLIRAHNSTAN
jgi:phosphoglycolate phosphatase